MRGVIGAPRCVMIVSVALSCLIRPRARGTGGLCRGYVVGVSEAYCRWATNLHAGRRRWKQLVDIVEFWLRDHSGSDPALLQLSNR